MSALFDKVRSLYEAGYKTSPLGIRLDPRALNIDQFTPAAVLIAITEREKPGMLLLHRPSNMRAHPGQIAFPGGKCDPGETPTESALREAEEELGINPGSVSVIGHGDTHRTGTGFEITPVIGVVPADLEIRPNPAEVAQWFEAPVNFVLNPANQVQKTLEWEGVEHAYIEIQWQEHRIWGVTGAIIQNLTRRLNWHG